jgi:hypothetical protein
MINESMIDDQIIDSLMVKDTDGLYVRRVWKEIDSGHSRQGVTGIDQCSRVASERRDVAGDVDDLLRRVPDDPSERFL